VEVTGVDSALSVEQVGIGWDNHVSCSWPWSGNLLSLLVAVFEQWVKIKLFCRLERLAVVTFVSLSTANGEAYLETVCCGYN
jgi:hypothetical protein